MVYFISAAQNQALLFGLNPLNSAPMTQRIDQTFANRKAKGQAVFVAYMMGGDPDLATSQKLLEAMPDAGVDIIELGIPFTDPMADGPVIEEAGIRAREAGMTLGGVLDCLLYTSPSPRDQRGSRMPSSA